MTMPAGSTPAATEQSGAAPVTAPRSGWVRLAVGVAGVGIAASLSWWSLHVGGAVDARRTCRDSWASPAVSAAQWPAIPSVVYVCAGLGFACAGVSFVVLLRSLLRADRSWYSPRLAALTFAGVMVSVLPLVFTVVVLVLAGSSMFQVQPECFG